VPANERKLSHRRPKTGTATAKLPAPTGAGSGELSEGDILIFISVLRVRRDHYLPRDAKTINYDSVSLRKKCFQQRDLDPTAIAESREEPFGLLQSFNSEKKREACKCCFGRRSLATAV
jgi:hypothetical protein